MSIVSRLEPITGCLNSLDYLSWLLLKDFKYCSIERYENTFITGTIKRYRSVILIIT